MALNGLNCAAVPVRIYLLTVRRCRQSNSVVVSICLCMSVYSLYSCSCEDRYVQERGVVMLREVARFNFLLPRN